MKIDNLVVQIIKAPNFNKFTTSDVRSAYIAISKDPFLDPVIIRRKLYAELLKLVNKGWLRKRSSSNKKGTRFVKTELFDVQKLIEYIADSSQQVTLCNDIKQSLTTKLNHYKAELLLNLGETEAYKELVTEIQYKYNEARDNNTKTLGKIKAIESLINQEKQQST